MNYLTFCLGEADTFNSVVSISYVHYQPNIIFFYSHFPLLGKFSLFHNNGLRYGDLARKGYSFGQFAFRKRGCYVILW